MIAIITWLQAPGLQGDVNDRRPAAATQWLHRAEIRTYVRVTASLESQNYSIVHTHLWYLRGLILCSFVGMIYQIFFYVRCTHTVVEQLVRRHLEREYFCHSCNTEPLGHSICWHINVCTNKLLEYQTAENKAYATPLMPPRDPTRLTLYDIQCRCSFWLVTLYYSPYAVKVYIYSAYFVSRHPYSLDSLRGLRDFFDIEKCPYM